MLAGKDHPEKAGSQEVQVTRQSEDDGDETRDGGEAGKKKGERSGQEKEPTGDSMDSQERTGEPPAAEFRWFDREREQHAGDGAQETD